MRAAIAALTLLLGGTILLTSGRAAADPGRTSSLSWLRMPGADACIATQALARSVEERLGRHVFVSAAEADVSVEGRIEKRKGGPGWHAVITIRDSKGALLGTRDIDRPDAACEAMNESLALIIAVMIDPEAKLSGAPTPLPPAAPTPPALPAPVTPPPVIPPEPEKPKPPPKEPLRAEGGVSGLLSLGLGPRIVPGAMVSGVLFPPGVPIGLRGYTALHLPVEYEKDSARGTFDLFYVGGAICPTARGKIVVGMLCIGGQIGAIRSHADTKGRGIEEKTLPLWNGVTEARLSLPLIAPVALTAGVAVIVPLFRPTFQYTRSDPSLGQDNLHKVSAVAATADFGIAFFFP